MSPKPPAIKTIDCERDDAQSLIAALRDKLSPRGDIVSEAGRRRTIELFGEALSPQQVVERAFAGTCRIAGWKRCSSMAGNSTKEI